MMAKRKSYSGSGNRMKLNVTVVLFALTVLLYGVNAFEGPPNQVVIRGMSVVMPCFTYLESPPEWYINHKLIFSGYEFTDDVKSWITLANGTRGHYDLNISYSEGMAGFYTCRQAGVLQQSTGQITVLDINCSILETSNITTAVCTAVITGNNVTRIHWEIIHEDSFRNATGAENVTNSVTFTGVQRQYLRSVLIISKMDLRMNGSCRLTLEFNYTKSSAYILEPGEEMANNIPTFSIKVPFYASVDTTDGSTGVDTTDGSVRPSDSVLWKFLTGIFGSIAIIIVVIIAVYVYCKRRKEKARSKNNYELTNQEETQIDEQNTTSAA